MYPDARTSIHKADSGVIRPTTRSFRLSHRWILGGVVLATLAGYAETTARFGHALAVADAHLYYTHAHSWYFDGDCDYRNNIAENRALEVRAYYLRQQSPAGTVVNVFPCGWSLVAMPFLALADGLTIAHNSVADAQIPRNGHSVYYRAVVPLGHVLVGLLGILASYAVAARYFSKLIAAISVACIWIGTNASYFISVEPTISHAASLGFVAMMIWASDTIHRDGWSLARAVVLGLACGMMMAVRHQNIAWIVVPILLLGPRLGRDAWEGRCGRFSPWKLPLITVLAAALCLVPQVGVNLATHGSVFGALPGFMPDWLHPAIWRELLAPRTGLFVLYPLSAVCLLGAIAMAWQKRHSPLNRALAVGVAAILYLNACAAFGPPRRYACCFIVFVLALAATIHWAGRSKWRIVLLGLLVSSAIARNMALMVLADRCLVDRDLFTATSTQTWGFAGNLSRLLGL
ncbi:MAG: hypothetical protein IH987_17280 [Planctomycetes bacterium]|nr:hypothetical protein [Planctomycetota bacterium]